MWNSPELGSFRGIEDNIREHEANQEKYQMQQMEMKKLGREQGINQPDLQHVNEALLAQQKQMGVLQQVQAASDENNRQAQAARDKELQAHMQTLAQEARTASEHAPTSGCRCLCGCLLFVVCVLVCVFDDCRGDRRGRRFCCMFLR